MTSNNNNKNNDDDKFCLRRLEEEIEALNVAAMTQPDVGAIWAQKVKLAAVKIQERELLLETHRVDQVKQSYEEQRRCSYKAEEEDCPICLETMHGEEIDDAPHFACCGKFTRKKCSSLQKLYKCPLCRGEFPTAEAMFIAMKKLAQKGSACAQWCVAQSYENGNGVEVNAKLAFQWYHRAAEQGFSFAMLKVAFWYLNLDNVPDRTADYAEARRWCQATVDKGHQSHAIRAMDCLGQLKYNGNGGQRDQKESVRLFTLVVAYSPEHVRASYHLGVCFANGEGELEKSLDRAKYYLEKAAKSVDATNPGFTQFLLGQTLHRLAIERFHGRTTIPGHSIMPEALYWARKAVALGLHKASEDIAVVENDLKSSCANCQRDADEFTDKLKCCTRCRAVWYCGKDCQIAHWRRGHKIDCYKSE